MAIKSDDGSFLKMSEIDAEFDQGDKPWKLSEMGVDIGITAENEVKMSSFYGLSSVIRSDLVDRGFGMIYDPIMDITWLQDANYAKTSGHDADGAMNWHHAKAWVNNLNYKGITGWRLPSAKLINSADPCFANDGSCDRGYNNARGELGHMYYIYLDNLSKYGTDGYLQPGYGVTNSDFIDNKTGQSVSILNLRNSIYWLDEEYPASLNPDHNWTFMTNSGSQYRHHATSYLNYAWAVRDGDVIPTFKVKDGMIYDPIMDITWLQDANYAKTSGHDADGKMSWDNAQAWVNNLNYKGITGWRLPSAKLIGNTTHSYDGSTDEGYNNIRSEMGRMYYLYLGNQGSHDADGNIHTQYQGGLRTSLTDSVSFENLSEGSAYWLDEERADYTIIAWSFATGNGKQQQNAGKINTYRAWAVHDGDVTDSATE